MSDYIKHQKMAYTIDEAGVMLSLSRAHIYRLIDCGELSTIKIGKSRRVTSQQLDAFVKRYEAACARRLGLPLLPRAKSPLANDFAQQLQKKKERTQ